MAGAEEDDAAATAALPLPALPPLYEHFAPPARVPGTLDDPADVQYPYRDLQHSLPAAPRPWGYRGCYLEHVVDPFDIYPGA